RPLTPPPCSLLYNTPHATYYNTLSLHDALPIFGPSDHAPLPFRKGSPQSVGQGGRDHLRVEVEDVVDQAGSRELGGSVRRDHGVDRKSTRLNSSHQIISYAVFCLKKKNTRTWYV